MTDYKYTVVAIMDDGTRRLFARSKSIKGAQAGVRRTERFYADPHRVAVRSARGMPGFARAVIEENEEAQSAHRLVEASKRFS
jgi:hypothetical protein